MSISDPIADMLTKIRNANLARHKTVDISTSKIKLEIIKVLKNEGYVRAFSKIDEGAQNNIRVVLKYDDHRKPVIHGIKRVSTPGRRVYVGYRKMERVLNGYGMLVVSTSNGITTGKKARKQGIGGESICTVW